MTPLTLGSASQNVPEDFPQLLELLGSRPQPAVVWYGSAGPSALGSEADRVELSGRVLQNWAVKLIGLFREELEEVFEDAGRPAVLLDTAPHWKAAAVALAAGALGAEVTTRAGSGGPDAEEPAASASLVVTDRPERWSSGAGPELGDAELAALSPGLLDDSFEDATGEAVPAWVLDVSAEVRQHPDQLVMPLEPVALPAAEETSGPRLITPEDWRSQEGAPAGVVGKLLSAWAHGRTVVLFDGEPGSPAWDQMLRNEGLS